MTIDEQITDRAGLRRIYREPTRTVLDKVVPRIDESAASFIARSTLFMVATTDGSSIDASPRGGPAGFVKVVDAQTVVFGDLVGNNRLDTYTNLTSNPAIALIMMVPGMEETLRINGTAIVTTNPELRERCAIDGRVPKVVVSIAVQECYVHCGAALRRAALWDTETWPDRSERTSAGAILKENLGLTDVTAEQIDAGLAEYYDNGVWFVGGDSGDA